ncbi:MAG: DUF1080 domain-containing protein, partial [Chitinophagaceae bacterium]|nr:DUF1080 domain-containing protein [Chitinophagaceae bacterium]
MLSLTKHAMIKIMLAVMAVFNFSSVTAQHSDNGFKKIFDGKTLNGWEGDMTHWKVEDGNIVAEMTPTNMIKVNTFLIWKGGKPGDFELKAEFRMSRVGNSGIQYRSELVKGVPFGLKGYQADIDGDNVYTGQNYEERGRGFLAKRGEKVTIEKGKDPVVTSMIDNGDSLKKYIRQDGWNQI